MELILDFVKNSFTYEYEKLIFDTLFKPLGSWLLRYKPSKFRTNACPKLKFLVFNVCVTLL